MEHLTLEQRTTQQLLREQGEAIILLKTKIDDGLFVKRDSLAKAIGEAVAAHMTACPGTELNVAIDRLKREGREGVLDRIAVLGLLLRFAGTAISILGAIAAAKGMGLIR